MRCGVAAPVVAARSSTHHQLHAACVPAPSPCLCSMVPFAQHALAAIELCGQRSGACKQWRRRVGKADDGSEQIRRGRSDAVPRDGRHHKRPQTTKLTCGLKGQGQGMVNVLLAANPATRSVVHDLRIKGPGARADGMDVLLQPTEQTRSRRILWVVLRAPKVKN